MSVNRTKPDRIFDALKDAFLAIAEGSVADSVVDEDTAADQKVLKIADTTGFDATLDQRKRVIHIGRDGDRAEINVLVSVQDGESITLLNDLTYPHTQSQGDTVEMDYTYHTVDHVRSWSKLQNGPEGGVPAVGLQFISEDPASEEYGMETLLSRWQCVLFDDTELPDPDDDANDRQYRRLQADQIRALFDDKTLDGNGLITQLGLCEPWDFEDDPDQPSENPVVGSYVEFTVLYQRYWGNTHI